MKIIALSLELRQPKLMCCHCVLSFYINFLQSPSVNSSKKFLQRVEFQHLYNGTFYDRKRYDRKAGQILRSSVERLCCWPSFCFVGYVHKLVLIL